MHTSGRRTERLADFCRTPWTPVVHYLRHDQAVVQSLDWHHCGCTTLQGKAGTQGARHSQRRLRRRPYHFHQRVRCTCVSLHAPCPQIAAEPWPGAHWATPHRASTSARARVRVDMHAESSAMDLLRRLTGWVMLMLSCSVRNRCEYVLTGIGCSHLTAIRQVLLGRCMR